MAVQPPKRSVFSGLGESFLAVLLGNIIYFALEPMLPPNLQHELFRPDFGLLLDFLACVVVFFAIRLLRAWFLTPKE